MDVFDLFIQYECVIDSGERFLRTLRELGCDEVTKSRRGATSPVDRTKAY